MSYTITKQYEGLPTDAAREAVAIMAKDRKTYAGEFAHKAATLRSVRAALQGFEGTFSQYVEDNGELPTEWLLNAVQDQLLSVIDGNSGLTSAMQWVAFDDSAEVAKCAADYLHGFDLAIDVFEKAAAFILSIAGCSHEERLEKLAKLEVSAPFDCAHYVPWPDAANYRVTDEESLMRFNQDCAGCESIIEEAPLEYFAGEVLAELEEIAAQEVERSPLAPWYTDDYTDNSVARLVGEILDNEEEFGEAMARSKELKKAAAAELERNLASTRKSPEYPKPRDLTPEEWSQLRKSGSSSTDDSGFFDDDLPF